MDEEELVIKPDDSWADVENNFYKKVTDLRGHGIKVSLAIGGWSESVGPKYSDLVNDEKARTKFIQHVVEFLEEYNFDGLDLDWEYPKCWQADCSLGLDSDREAFALWVREIKDAFDKKGYLLSAAVSPSKKIIDHAYDVQSLAQNLDWISVMTYDYHGYWDGKTGHVSPMYSHPQDDYEYFNVVSIILSLCTAGA